MSWTGPHRFAASIIVHNRHLGDFTFPAFRGEALPGSPLAYYKFSYATFCPVCGEVWGRIVVTDEQGKQCRFQVASLPCEQHMTWQGEVAGSLIFAYHKELFEYFPAAAVEREFELHLKHFEKELI